MSARASREASAVALITLGSAAVVGYLVAHGHTRELDHQFRRRLRRARKPALSRAAKLATRMGEPPAQISFAALTALALQKGPQSQRRAHDGHRARTLVSLSPLFASVLAVMAHRSVKLLYKRRRPPGALLRGTLEPSFPSGHSTVAAATFGTVAYVLAHDRIARPGTASALLTVPLCVGLSRVYLDRHWVTDIAGGWLIGTGISASIAAAIAGTDGRSIPARSRAPARRPNKPQDSST
jgi:undecaprenyl-diphosphatase